MPGATSLVDGSEDAQVQLVKGACRAYRNDTFRYYLHSLTAFVMFLAFVFDCVICRYAGEVDFYDSEDSKLTSKEVAAPTITTTTTPLTTKTTATVSGLKKSTETI